MHQASYWRTNRQRLTLTGEVCPNCGAKLFPPRDVCPHCHGPAKEPFVFSGRGHIYSFSTMYNAPEGYEGAAPYTVAWVKLDEGPMVTAQLADVEQEDVFIGMPVEMVTRKVHEDGEAGLISYNYKFRPVLQTVS
ncbi:MAG: Zn-ribbon domain-containing OB-fold protein [Anaerolineae bacterium]